MLPLLIKICIVKTEKGKFSLSTKFFAPVKMVNSFLDSRLKDFLLGFLSNHSLCLAKSHFPKMIDVRDGLSGSS